jgi:hypothetical protein
VLSDALLAFDRPFATGDSMVARQACIVYHRLSKGDKEDNPQGRAYGGSEFQSR